MNARFDNAREHLAFDDPSYVRVVMNLYNVVGLRRKGLVDIDFPGPANPTYDFSLFDFR